MILVTGATGQYGSKVVEHLLKKGMEPKEISVLVRDADKALVLKEKGIKINIGDYTDFTTLEKAFQGVDKLLLVSSNNRDSFDNRTLHHKNAIEAARKSNVRNIIYTSFVRKEDYQESAIAEFQNSHLESEKYLKESGIDYTILQNGIYAEMILAFIGNKVLETDTIYFPAEEGKASWVLREELAEAAAHILITKGHENKSYTLTNNEIIGFNDIAKFIANATGKQITYSTPNVEEFKVVMTKAGVPEMYIDMFIMWGTALAQKNMDAAEDTLARFLDRNPTSMSQFITNIYG